MLSAGVDLHKRHSQVETLQGERGAALGRSSDPGRPLLGPATRLGLASLRARRYLILSSHR